MRVMKQDALISVIIPVYNSEKYVSRCLDSIINNTYKNLQIICVNDGSTDRSLELIAEYANKDDRIIPLTKDNGGAASARNEGMRIAKGDCLSFVDADDWLHPQFFEIMLRSMLSGNADAVMCPLQRTDQYFADFETLDAGQDSTEVLTEGDFGKQKRFEEFRKYSCGVLYRKESVKHFFPERLKVTEDNLFNLLNVTSFSEIVILKHPMYYYFNNNESVMNTYDGMDAYHDFFLTCDYLTQWKLEDHTKKELICFLYKRYLFYHYYFPDARKDQEVKLCLKKCRGILRKNDQCLEAFQMICFRTLLKVPFAYVVYKTMKDKIKSLVNEK